MTTVLAAILVLIGLGLIGFSALCLLMTGMATGMAHARASHWIAWASSYGLGGLALCFWGSNLLQAASDRAVPVIDLRQVCTLSDDYFDPIEPNGRGGKKIAKAIAFRLGAYRAPASRHTTRRARRMPLA